MSTREPVAPARASAARDTRGGQATPAKELEQLKRQIAELSAAAEAIATDLRATLAVGRDDGCDDSAESCG